MERLYIILSFRPSAGSWLGVLAYRRPCNHASQCGFFISHGVSLWAGKLAVLLRLHHSRHSRQLASSVKDLPLCGMNKIGCSMNKIGWLIKSKHRARYARCVPEQNRVVRGEHFSGAVIGAVLRGRTPKKRFGAVSYTHLTLPTICSV